MTRQSRLLIVWTIILLLAAACAPATPTPVAEITLVPANMQPTSAFTDPVLRLGEQTYNLVCAHCHGYEGEGQIASSIINTLELGMNLVPPQNSTGHTWRHPDQLLIRVIKEGIQNPLDQYPMPAFGNELTEEQIEAVLAYIKLWWTPAQREHQARITRNWAERSRQLGITDEP